MVRSAAAALALTASMLGLSACAQNLLLLDFYSPNCGPCRQMMPTIDNFIKAGYPVRKVDASTEPQLAARFGISAVPCFVMLVNGSEIGRIHGACAGEEIQALYQKAQQTLQAARAQNSPGLPHTGDAIRPQSPDPPRINSPQPVAGPHAALLNATVRLRVNEGQASSCGTGTIIDARDSEALVITCGHLFRDSQGKVPVSVEMFEVIPDGIRAIGQASGQVVCFDLERDVALVSFRPNRKVAVAPVASVRTNVQRGDRVTSIGCSNGQDPSVIETRVTHLDRYQGAPNLEASGAPVEGRSGGGLFNAEGNLIGICYAADHEGNEGLYAALESIHDQLAKLGLNLGEETKVAATSPGGSRSSITRGQVLPLVDVVPVDSNPSTPATPPAELRPVEKAGWEELLAAASKSEVMIIVRPKEPGGKSEILQLDNVSPEFIRRLETLQRAAKSPDAVLK